MKILSMGIELFQGRADGWLYRRTDGQIDMTKLKVAFRNFANAHKNER